MISFTIQREKSLLSLNTPNEVMLKIATQARERRLQKNWTQAALSSRSGVSASVIKKFEKTGKISLESLLNIALVLGCLDDCAKLFEMQNVPSTLFVEDKPKRQRGRKS